MYRKIMTELNWLSINANNNILTSVDGTSYVKVGYRNILSANPYAKTNALL
jgi:hypothetical protein